ncbi:MAG: PKD domain-containing protein [Ferruginibacter sp.]
MRKNLLLIFLLFITGAVSAQDKSNRGKEFWLGYGNNISFTEGDYDGVNNQTMVLYITTEEAATVTVSVNSTSWSTTVNIPANSVNVSIELPKTGAADCRILNEGVFDKAIHIVSTEPVVVYAHQYNTKLSGATMLFPVEAYGYTYYSVNFKQPPVGMGWGKSWFYVIASEDNTRLQITPSDTTESGVLPGETITVNLNKGQLYNIFGKISDDNVCELTGSKVVSVAGADGKCHPVALFSGCSRFILCLTDGGEVAQQQIFPASAWGTRYLTYHSIIATSNPLTTPFLNYYRVIVSDPSTIVKRNGVVLTGLQKNSFYQFQSNSGDYIEADKPVVVGQYTPNSDQCSGTPSPIGQDPLGDPELLFLPSIEQGIKKTRVYNTKNANITINYLTIIIHKNGIASLKINGAAVPAAQRAVHPNNSDYTVVARRLIGPAAQYSIESDSGFTAMIYGAGKFESYGYIAGTLINNLNMRGNIENVLNVTGKPNEYTCPESPFKLNVLVAYRAASLNWQLSKVEGLSPAVDTLMLNPTASDSQIISGRKFYSYMLDTKLRFADTGIYNIPVTYTSPEIDHCSHEETSFATIIVKEGPVANFDYSYKGCSTDTAFFTGLADINNYNINKYAWLYDDNTRDTAVTSSKKFEPGDHPVLMQAIADNGCVDDTTRIITTNSKPVSKFGYERNICIGDSVLFKDSSTIDAGSITAWHWDFADGSSSILSNNNSFYHQYNLKNSYAVSLVTVSDKGCVSDSVYKTVEVKERPQVSFTYDGKFCEDSSIVFTPAVVSNDNTIQNSTWFFGDGQQLTVTNTSAVTHAYTDAQNNIPVKLVVNGGPGCESDTARQTIAIIHEKPEAKFEVTANSFCPQKNIVFNYTGSGNIKHWQWNFGNSNSNEPSPATFSYFNGGNYPVSLIVTSSDGCASAAFTQTVTIYDYPAVDAGPSLLKTVSQPIELRAVANNPGNYNYEWSPADFLNSSTILNPVTTSPEDIVYTLKVSGGPGNCEAIDTVSIKVLKDLFIPSAFSPNNDGINDVWNIPSINNNPSAAVTIFNRWGQIIYQSQGYNKPWDGSYKGVQQPAGAYHYIIQPDVKKNRKITGYIIIIR